MNHYVRDEARVKELNEHMRIMSNDASGTLFSARALEYIEAEVYRVEYADYKARKVFPVEYKGGEHTEVYTYRVSDRIGEASRVNSAGDTDIPYVGLTGSEFRNPVGRYGAKYKYSTIELAKAQESNIRLDADSAMAARDAVERKIDKVAWFGDADINLTGFLNNPLIPKGNVPNGAGGFPEFSKKTPLEILRDIIEILNYSNNQSNGIEQADTLLMPIDQYNYLVQPLQAGSDTSILTWIIKNVPHLKTEDDIVPVAALKGAGTGGSDVMIAYKKDARKLSMIITYDIKILPPQLHEMSWNTLMHAGTASVIVKYPKSVVIREMI